MKHKKFWKWIIILAVLVIFCYLNQELLSSIIGEIGHISPFLLLLCCIFSVLYYIEEGRIICIMARKYNDKFSMKHGIVCAYYCNFYKLITLGSGSGIAEIYYLNSKNILAAKATSMSMIQYVLHKLAITLYGLISCALIYMEHKEELSNYSTYILLGGLLTLAIAIFLVFICVCDKLSKRLFDVLDKRFYKREKILKKIDEARVQVSILQIEGRELLKEKKKLFHLFLIDIIKITFWYLIPSIYIGYKSGMSLFYIMILTSVAFMIAGIIPAPAGMGSVEFVFIMMLRDIVTSSVAASAIVIFRFATNIIPFLIGGVCVGISKREATLPAKQV